MLQRILAVDEDIKAKWSKAFAKGEVACEKLGSIHLLSQGIFAFKVDASGARTDLVFNEPPDGPLLSRAVEGLVLTEWKKAASADAAPKFAEAETQAELYREGPLAGLELARFRYLVVVSEKQLPTVPADTTNAKGVIYRHINIAIDPEVPSKIAAKKRGSS